MKNKETYAKAKSILEQYGETIASDARPTTSVPENANKGMLPIERLFSSMIKCAKFQYL